MTLSKDVAPEYDATNIHNSVVLTFTTKLFRTIKYCTYGVAQATPTYAWFRHNFQGLTLRLFISTALVLSCLATSP